MLLCAALDLNSDDNATTSCASEASGLHFSPTLSGTLLPRYPQRLPPQSWPQVLVGLDRIHKREALGCPWSTRPGLQPVFLSCASQLKKNLTSAIEPLSTPLTTKARSRWQTQAARRKGQNAPWVLTPVCVTSDMALPPSEPPCLHL